MTLSDKTWVSILTLLGGLSALLVWPNVDYGLQARANAADAAPGFHASHGAADASPPYGFQSHFAGER